MTGPAARIPAETPKAVNVRLARETMEPRQTEFKCRASTLARGPTLLLEQPFVFHGQREMPIVSLGGLQYQRRGSFRL